MFARAQKQQKMYSEASYKPALRTPSMSSSNIPNSVLLSMLGCEDTRPDAYSPNKTGLPDALKARVERLTGMPLDDVRVHRNSDKPAEHGLDEAMRQNAKRVRYYQENQIPVAEKEADRFASSVKDAATPAEVKAELGSAMGADFSDVRFHTDAAEKVDDIGARAYTTGRDVYFGKGGFDPTTAAHELVHTAQQGAVTSEAPTVSAPMGGVQMDILIEDEFKKHYDKELIDKLIPYIKPSFIFTAKERKKKPVKDWNIPSNYPDGEGLIKNDIRAMLRKYSQGKAFENEADLGRQIVQDIKLKLLGLDNMIGIKHQDGQFSTGTKSDDNKTGRTGKIKPLRIYRTMPASDWAAYEKNGNLDNILKGHGGSLGQALHYFVLSKKNYISKEKTPTLDNVLVEFQFEGKAEDLIDYSAVKGQGEGDGPTQSGKLSGKLEKNDIFGRDDEIFSIHLGKSKDCIKKLNPTVKLIDRVSY